MGLILRLLRCAARRVPSIGPAEEAHSRREAVGSSKWEEDWAETVGRDWLGHRSAMAGAFCLAALGAALPTACVSSRVSVSSKVRVSCSSGRNVAVVSRRRSHVSAVAARALPAFQGLRTSNALGFRTGEFLSSRIEGVCAGLSRMECISPLSAESALFRCGWQGCSGSHLSLHLLGISA